MISIVGDVSDLQQNIGLRLRLYRFPNIWSQFVISEKQQQTY